MSVVGRAAVVLCLAATMLAVVVSRASAVSQPYLPRFSTDDNGSIALFGNMLMTCPPSASGCAASQNAVPPDSFTFTRDQDKITAEAALDGIYVIRTSLDEPTLHHDDVVLRYKGLEDVERFFRAMNSKLDVRPIRHRLADRVRAHVFLRMLSYYLIWLMKQALAPILFHDHDKPAARDKRADPVAPAQRSDQALLKAARKRTVDDHPVHSFTSLLTDLGTICANHIQPADQAPAFTMMTSPTPLQRQAFDLLGVSHRHGYA